MQYTAPCQFLLDRNLQDKRRTTKDRHRRLHGIGPHCISHSLDPARRYISQHHMKCISHCLQCQTTCLHHSLSTRLPWMHCLFCQSRICGKTSNLSCLHTGLECKANIMRIQRALARDEQKQTNSSAWPARAANCSPTRQIVMPHRPKFHHWTAHPVICRRSKAQFAHSPPTNWATSETCHTIPARPCGATV